ncbi:methylated-DNA--[protein]-cysteine S-methyltransferase [Streptomyces sodiiphilus]|uniref:Methylated-DNA--[protein]-cysteine S-methyltransferase n=1 Tax=Streptomyces sodiiphilus TaxID=226217 RepID=A0ABN2P4S1_9ACTN
MLYTTHPSPLGELTLTGPRPGTLASVRVEGQKGGVVLPPGAQRDDGAFAEAVRQLDAYFAGDLKEFDLVLETRGSAFREQVWRALDLIPYGGTVTYGRVAAMAGLPAQSVRAVGGAIGANPLMVVRPCHRVIGANGALTGFAGGMERKRQLLTLEGVLLG